MTEKNDLQELAGDLIHQAQKIPLVKRVWGNLKNGMALFIQNTGTKEAIEIMMCTGIISMVGLVWQMRADLAAIRAEVDANPAEKIEAKVDHLAQQLLTKDDVALVVSADQWRRSIESELMDIKARVMFQAWKSPEAEKSFREPQIEGQRVLPR